jgi:hypothetical protein
MSCLTWLLHELGGRRDRQNWARVRFSPALTVGRCRDAEVAIHNFIHSCGTSLSHATIALK